jgi:XRE family transcriptional regulator, stress-response regulator
MALLRRVLGETLRGQRLRQRRTLREVSSTARVSLGYLSEIERGQKEASSELLRAICDALELRLSDLLREVSDSMRMAESGAAAPVRSDLGPIRMPAVVPAGGAEQGEPAAVDPVGLQPATHAAEAVSVGALPVGTVPAGSAPTGQVSARHVLEPYGGDSREVLDSVLGRLTGDRVIAA